ncbi:EF-hand domain-containing family member B-like [Styela clava]
MQSNIGKYRDSTPKIPFAGKVFDQGGTANECIHPPDPEPEVPQVVQKFSNTDAGRPVCGTARIHHGRANDADEASKFYHGVTTAGSLKASDLVTPKPKTRFQSSLEAKKESLYESHINKPLGKPRDNTPFMSSSIDRLTTAFGIATLKNEKAGEVVNPPKSQDQVSEESQVAHELYTISHNDYNVGETYDRRYDWSRISRGSVFGVETPHFNDGRLTRKTLTWLHDKQAERGAKIVTKRVDDFRERNQPQLGKVHDPIADTLNVPSDHTFGVLLRPDEYGAGDLLHGRSPDTYLRGRDRERGVMHAIRQHLKKANYHNFDNLSAAFKHYDTNNDGFIDNEELRNVCWQLNVPIEDEMLFLLMSYCGGEEGKIDYLKFANFLNWKDKMPIVSSASQTKTAMDVNTKEAMPPETPTLKKQIDKALTDHKTSSSLIGVGATGALHNLEYRTYGVPTVRSDLPSPSLRRVSDRTNYGDESDAYGLISPSMYSQRGVYETDFFQPRSREELRRIFANIGVEITAEMFEKLWNAAQHRDPRGKGEVSVETFRSTLDDVQANAITA